MELTIEHVEILKHTKRNGLFCGGSPEMKQLCEFKLMESAGRKSFVPDEYFRITSEGEGVLDDLAELANYKEGNEE